ncbi:unnamed protein product, partial [Discosporangium mesarthrocarpum]
MPRTKAPHGSSGLLIPSSPVGPNSSTYKSVRGNDSNTPTKNSVVARRLEARGHNIRTPRGTAVAIAEDFRISQITAHRHLKEHDSQIARGECMDLSRRCKRAMCPPCKYGQRLGGPIDTPHILPLKWAAKDGVSLASLWRLCQGEVREVERWIEPVLSDLGVRVSRQGGFCPQPHGQ